MSEAKSERRQVPLRPGMFKIPEQPGEEPYLFGCKCRECGEYYFPSRVICLGCSAADMEEVALSGRGKVYSYTVARQQLPGALVQVPYAIAIITLEEGCQVRTPVTEDWESIDIDADMEIYFEKVGQDSEGNEQLAFKFRAAGSAPRGGG
jgi:uncharacterized OB-fold protein